MATTVAPAIATKPQPSLVVLYRDPLSRNERRISYWTESPGHPRVVVEELSKDAHGTPGWYPPGGNGMIIENILAHLMLHQLKVQAQQVAPAATVTLDYRDVAIPHAPV